MSNELNLRLKPSKGLKYEFQVISIMDSEITSKIWIEDKCVRLQNCGAQKTSGVCPTASFRLKTSFDLEPHMSYLENRIAAKQPELFLQAKI